MCFRLVPNSVTLDDLERRNSPNRSVISPNSVAFGTDYVKVVEDTMTLHVPPALTYVLIVLVLVGSVYWPDAEVPRVETFSALLSAP